MRLDAKHGKLSQEFLDEYGLTNGDLKIGLKLPLNAYTGCLRATFNDLYDPRQGFNICTTGQLLILQLIHDLKEIPTVEICENNTDAIQYLVDEKYAEQSHKVLDDWQKLTGLELEQDKIVKLVQRDVNNFAEIVQTGDNDYEVHYKGGELTRGEHEFKWDKEHKCFHYTYKKSLKSNSMSICSEAILKKLLFDIPVEETINNCNDMIRFQIISHLGSTYEKCVQESVHGDIELQRNNRIYAGKEPSGTIIKVKPNGRRDSLANCPPNPIVDNSNKLVIDNVNKSWYIEYANEKVNDFLGVKRLEDYKKEELLELANEYNLEIDKKTKKDELIELIKEKRKRNGEKEKMTKKQENEMENTVNTPVNEYEYEMLERQDKVKLLNKINNFRKLVHERKFVLDKAMTSNLGGEEYHSIGQYYNAVQELCLECGLDFCFDMLDETRFERDIIKPATGAPRHLSTVKCIATLTDIDTGYDKCYEILASGSDTTDKGISGACTLAFRNWFKFNFTPKSEFEWDDNQNNVEQVKESEPKVPAYIPPKAKEEIAKKVVATEQHVDSDEEDKTYIIENIYKLREVMENPSYGEKVLKAITEGNPNSAQILSYKTSIKSRLLEYKDKLGE